MSTRNARSDRNSVGEYSGRVSRPLPVALHGFLTRTRGTRARDARHELNQRYIATSAAGKADRAGGPR